MEFNPELKQKVQIFLAIAIAIAALRTGYVLYERHAEKSKPEAEQQSAPPLNPDYYVVPKRLHPYDLRSARELSKQPVWVKEGYRYPYYPYDSGSHHANFDHEAGMLLPIQKLEIKDVISDTAPNSGGQKQVMAIFEQGGKTYAVQVGLVKDGDYKIYSDEMLYIQDPRDLYKHWSPDVWQSIDKHEVKQGMNELQADFAIGVGRPEKQDDPSWKTVHYENGGSPVTITYRDGKAVQVKAGKAS